MLTSVIRGERPLGAAIRRARRAAGLSQEALAERVGGRQATVSRLEGGGGATLDTLFAILAALDLELVVQPRSRAAPEDIADLF